MQNDSDLIIRFSQCSRDDDLALPKCLWQNCAHTHCIDGEKHKFIKNILKYNRSCGTARVCHLKSENEAEGGFVFVDVACLCMKMGGLMSLRKC